MNTAISRGGLLAALLVLAAAAVAPAAAQGGKITVFAAASLREAYEAAAPSFTRRTGTAVAFNFAGSDTLATQIVQGAPADVFAAANEAQMKRVSDAGLTAGAPRVFARNRLVLIVPKGNPGRVTGLAQLARPGLKLVLAAATVPVGGYARDAFKKLAGQGGYSADFAAAVEKNVVSNELDVKAVTTKVALGEGDAGIVYSTDVTQELAPRVAVIAFPPGISPDAAYPIAVVKNATSASAAAAFVEFVLSSEGQSFLKARGFLAP